MSKRKSNVEIQTGLWKDTQGEVRPGLSVSGIARTTLDDILAKEIGLTIARFKKGLDAAATGATQVEIEFGVTIEGEGKLLVVSTKAGAALTIRASWGK